MEGALGHPAPTPRRQSVSWSPPCPERGERRVRGGWRLPSAPLPGLTVDPDNGAAPGARSLTLVAPAVLQGGLSDDQLGPAALIGQPAPGRWPQGLPILGPAHRAV